MNLQIDKITPMVDMFMVEGYAYQMYLEPESFTVFVKELTSAAIIEAHKELKYPHPAMYDLNEELRKIYL